MATARRLNPNHEQILAKAGISREQAEAWGIWSCSTPDGLEGTDLDHQGNHGKTGLVFPLRQALGGGDYRVTYQMRVDDHLVDPDKGIRKYAQAGGVGAIINVPAIMAERVGVATKVLVVEGTKQTIAASLYAPEDFLVFGIQGARNWSSEGIPLSVLCELVPQGAEVWLGFDADWQTNPDVWAAAKYLKGHLETGAGASKVRLIEIISGLKTGLDDFLGSNPDPTSRPAMLKRLLDAAGTGLGRKPAAKRRPATATAPTAGSLVVAGDVTPASEMAEAMLDVSDLLTYGEGEQVLVADGLLAVFGGPQHGIWVGANRANPVTGENQLALEQIADYIPWRSASTRKVRTTATGQMVSVDGIPTRWTVEIVRVDGRVARADRLTDSESTDITRVVDAAGAAVAVPATPAHRVALGNVLRILGDRAGRAAREELVSTGWVVDPDLGPVWAAPAGSISATGVTTELTVGPPLGSDEDSLPDALGQIGFDRIAEGNELREGVRAFAALIDMAPTRPEVGIALIGAMAAAPLRLSRRCSVYLDALPKVGKGHLLGAAAWFWTPTGPSEFAIDLPDSSRASATAIASWCRDGVVFADDFKLQGGDGDLAVIQAFGTLARAGYTGASGSKATKEGGLRRRSSTATIALMAGEEAHPDAATMQRVVALKLVDGEVDRTAGGPVDQFAAAYGRTGLARAVWAHYLRWLARRVQGEDDPLAALRRDGDNGRGLAMADLGTSRAAEAVSVISAGLAALYDWAEEADVLDLLPDSDLVDLALNRLVDGGTEEHAAGDPATLALAQVAEQIAARRIVVEAHDGTQPSVADPSTLGWVPSEIRPGEHERPRGATVLRLSRDRASVVVTSAAVTGAMRAAGRTIAPAKLAAAMSAAGYPGGREVRCPEPLGIATRPRGWVVPAAKVGLDAVALAPAEPRDAAAF